VSTEGMDSTSIENGTFVSCLSLTDVEMYERIVADKQLAICSRRLLLLVFI